MKRRPLFFGKNWKSFSHTYLNRDRIEEAKKSLADFLRLESLRGKYFLDIGCGSGLFSLAAYELGASKIVSFDTDLLCVECCKHLRKKVGNPYNWEILEGSILDEKFLTQIEKADIVYSWGTLHHTGRIWEAIENAAKLVAPGGLFYISIYNSYICFI